MNKFIFSLVQLRWTCSRLVLSVGMFMENSEHAWKDDEVYVLKLSSTLQDAHVLQSWTAPFHCVWLIGFIWGSYTGALTATIVIWVPGLKHTKHSQCSGVPRSTRRVKGYIITFHCFNNTWNDFIRNQRVFENSTIYRIRDWEMSVICEGLDGA